MLMRTTNHNLFPDVFNALFDTTCTATVTPAINIIERENEYTIELAAAGMRREDLHVSLDASGDNLIVNLEHKSESNGEKTEGNKERYLRHEFGYTKFHRTFFLPDNVDRDAITAGAHDGVLTITLPKRVAPQHEARVIEIA